MGLKSSLRKLEMIKRVKMWTSNRNSQKSMTGGSRASGSPDKNWEMLAAERQG